MDRELEEEFLDFKCNFEESEGALVFGRYFDESMYEDDYGNSLIEEYMEKFADMVREYLSEKAPGKYVVTTGYCVFVMTVEEAQKRRLYHFEDYIVE